MTPRLLLAGVVALAAAGSAACTRPAPTERAEPSSDGRPLVSGRDHGGLCHDGRECETAFTITDSTISRPGLPSRRLSARERQDLLDAIAEVDPSELPPFEGTCPTAYDGTETVYRFRGVERPLASCTYDLTGVEAVVLTERLLETLERRGG